VLYIRIGHPTADAQSQAAVFRRKTSYTWQTEYLEEPEGMQSSERWPPCRVCGRGIGVRMDSAELSTMRSRWSAISGLVGWIAFGIAVAVARLAPSKPADIVAGTLGVLALCVSADWWTYQQVRPVGRHGGHIVRFK
jgi:hypothetical protein